MSFTAPQGKARAGQPGGGTGTWKGDFGTKRSQGEGRKGNKEPSRDCGSHCWALRDLHGTGKPRAPAGTPGDAHGIAAGGGARLSTMQRQMLKQLLKRSIRNVFWEGEKLSFKPPKQRPAVSASEPSPAPEAAPVPCAAWGGWLSSLSASTPKGGCFWEFLHIPSIKNHSQC